MADETKGGGFDQGLMRALQAARPSGLDRLGTSPAARASSSEDIINYKPSEVKKVIPADDFTRRVEQVTETAAVVFPQISFLMSDVSTSTGTPPVVTNKVKVLDGKVNGTFPAGMGFGNYVLTIPHPESSLIYVGLTFNPTTQAITSRFLEVDQYSTPPVSRIDSLTSGFLYFLIGFTYLDSGSAFKIWQTRLGDINFAFNYGEYNGLPALLPTLTDQYWLPVPLA